MNRYLTRFYQRIAEKADDYSASPVLIVAFGDSVTQGIAAYKQLIPAEVYHQRLKGILERHWPQTTFSVINAGVGSETAGKALARIDRDVIRHQPDLVLVGFALNDALSGIDGLPRFKNSLQQIIAEIKNGTDAEIILLTPNFMTTAAQLQTAPEHEHLREKFAAIQNSGALAAYAEAVRNTAAEYACSTADVFAAWQQLAAAGTNTDNLLANGLNHPTGEAHSVTAQLLEGIICDS